MPAEQRPLPDERRQAAALEEPSSVGTPTGCARHSPCYRLGRWVVGVVALLCAAGALPAEPIAAGTAWSQPWFTRLDARFPGQGFHARWDIHRCACGDAWIEAEETLPEGISQGELLLVGGRVLLVRGFEGRGEDLRAMVDSPMLMLQLLFVLLQKSEPGGPAAVSERRELAHADPLYPLNLETGGAQGGFPAPWETEGVAYRFADGSHRFDLEFGFEMQVLGETPSVSEIDLSGILDYQPREFPLDTDLDITGWQLIALRDDEIGFFDQAKPKTLAELRALVKARKAAR